MSTVLEDLETVSRHPIRRTKDSRLPTYLGLNASTVTEGEGEKMELEHTGTQAPNVAAYRPTYLCL